MLHGFPLLLINLFRVPKIMKVLAVISLLISVQCPTTKSVSTTNSFAQRFGACGSLVDCAAKCPFHEDFGDVGHYDYNPCDCDCDCDGDGYGACASDGYACVNCIISVWICVVQSLAILGFVLNLLIFQCARDILRLIRERSAIIKGLAFVDYY